MEQREIKIRVSLNRWRDRVILDRFQNLRWTILYRDFEDLHRLAKSIWIWWNNNELLQAFIYKNDAIKESLYLI